MKKVIAAAVAAAFIAPAAFAASDSNVTLYGSLRGFADYVDGNHGMQSAFRIQNGGSRLGFKGSDKINNDVSIIWQVESAISPNDGSGTWASRNSFVGIETNAGTLRIGNFDSAYTRMDQSGPQAELFDNYGSSVDPKQKYGFYGRANSRQKNSINFETTNLSGFVNGLVARLSYGSDNTPRDGGVNTPGNAWTAAASGTFSVGGFSVGAGYQHAKGHSLFVPTVFNVNTIYSGSVNAFSDASADTSSLRGAKSQSYKVATNFKFDTGLNVGLAWEHNEDKWNSTIIPFNNAKVGAGKIKQDTYFAAINLPVGNWLVQGGYGWADKLKGDLVKSDGTKAQMALLGTQYAFSKRSRFYSYLSWVDNEKNAAFSTGYDSFKFAAFGSTPVGLDKTGYGVSLGLRTDF